MPSPESQLLLQSLRAQPRPDTQPSFAEMRASMEAMTGQNPAPAEAQMEPVVVAGVACEWTRIPNRTDPGEGSSAKTILYLHGGGFCIGSIATHRGLVARIAAASGTCVLSVDYRLAPEHPYPAALDDAVAVYRWLVDRGHSAARIVIAGDSAGGGLALATLQRLRDAQVPLPAAAVLLSPWADLSLSGDSMRSKIDEDPMIRPADLERMANAYRGQHAADSPELSPLFGDLAGLPPISIEVGTAEILLDDSIRLAERARADGVSVELATCEGLVHVYPFFAPFIPEANEAIARIGGFVRKHM